MDEISVDGVEDELTLTSSTVGVVLKTGSGPVKATFTLEAAEVLIAALREGADDVQRRRQAHGAPLGSAAYPSDIREAVSCKVGVFPDGLLLLEFRHEDGSTTPVLLAREGLSAVCSEAATMGEPPKRPDA